MSMIFISYRQEDCAPQARALFERLRHHHPDQVFFDAAVVMAGDEFGSKIGVHLTQCRVLLALIGRDWHQARNDEGQFRLNDEQDWVRREISMALQRRIRVIPVLVDGAPQPTKKSLPEDLHPLLDRIWVRLDIRHGFEEGVGSLLKVIQAEISSMTSSVSPELSVVPSSPSVRKINPQRTFRQDPKMRWASDFGVDEQGGWVWADLRVDNVVQRLRWIKPGSFVMGDKVASPAHQVRITKGFWLADTACTEMLWSAVTEGPVDQALDDAQNPVRHVSWQAIQNQFMTSLNLRLARIEAPVVAMLPSEAQWEYACRAEGGEDFSFKLEKTKIRKPVNKRQVNCDGWYGQVVAAKHFDPNPWGLFQMHGNVWEWCRDAHRVYVMDVPQGCFTDPLGREDGYTSVLKGGSWRDSVLQARSSARRCGVLRSHCGDDIGFRFLLAPCE